MTFNISCIFPSYNKVVIGKILKYPSEALI